MACESDKVLFLFFLRTIGVSEGVGNRCERRGGQSVSCLSVYEISRAYTDTKLDLTKGSVGCYLRGLLNFITHTDVPHPGTSFSHPSMLYAHVVPTSFTLSPTISSPVRGLCDARDRFHVIYFANGCRGGNDDKDDNGDGRRGITPNPTTTHHVRTHRNR